MKRLLTAFGFVYLTLLVSAVPVAAQADTTVIKNFHAEYAIYNDVHGGRMEVVETFAIQFTPNTEKHGPIRAIPTKYQNVDHRLRIISVKKDGQDEPYSTSSQNDNRVLKIGHADVFVTGQTHTYELRYEVRNIINFLEDKDFDEWYWDINGDQWSHPFENVSGEVRMPEDWDFQGLPSASCYTGRFGITESVCTIARTETGFTFAADKTLLANENLTVAVPLHKGLFEPRNTSDWLRENVLQFAGITCGLALAAVSFRQWYLWGRDHKGRGTIVPQFEPPKGLTPAEVGLLNDYYVHDSDLTATIIDLAVRGYIRIHDEETKKLGVLKSRSFTLELTNAKFAGLKQHEKSLLNALFKTTTVGTKQVVKDLDRDSMYRTVTGVRSQLKKSLTKEYGLFDASPTRAYVIVGITLGIITGLFIFGAATAGWGWIVGSIVAALVSIWALIFMGRRSHAGVEAYEHIKGLKLYMDTAEKDRLAMMQSVDRPYAEPSHTVELYEKLLPYAVALGVEKSWSKQFENIYKQQPDWYTGNMSTFNAVYFTNSLASGISSMNSGFSASTSSTSSGSGGGGFSGGGGGGGGGGSW